MGCASSNQEDAKDAAKAKKGTTGGGGGNQANAGFEAADTPKQNPYTTLTHKEIFRLKMSYKAVRRTMEETGVAMFIKMFENNAELKNHFAKFKDKENATLMKSEMLMDHATSVMESIDTALTDLDDAEKTHKSLKTLGGEHKARGIRVESLDDIKQPFLRAVEDTLGDRYTEAIRNIYETFIEYMIKAMKEGYD